MPLGATYLELVSVVDAAEAATSPFGRFVGRHSSESPQPFGWAVRTDDLEPLLRRHGLRATEGSRVRPDGSVLRWRVAGLDDALREPHLPFFIEWEEGAELPGAAAGAAIPPGARIRELQVRGDATRLAEWLGRHRLPVTVHHGSSGVMRVVVATDEDEIVLRAV